MIFVGDQSLVGGYRPVDAERGVAPQKAPIVLGRIIGAHLVYDLRIGLQRAISVREFSRYPELREVFGRKHSGYMPTIGRR